MTFVSEIAFSGANFRLLGTGLEKRRYNFFFPMESGLMEDGLVISSPRSCLQSHFSASP